MPLAPLIHIESRSYSLNPDCNRYQVPLEELGPLRMIDIPPHHHLEVLGVSFPTDQAECELWIVNGGEPGEDEHLSVYGGAWIAVDLQGAEKTLARLRRAFPVDAHVYPKFEVSDFRGLKASAFLSLSFQGRGETTVREAIEPFLAGFRRLSRPDVHAFICHASEDKPFARKLAASLRSDGASIWLDELEIRVGDSIVQKVSEGLQGASHLVILLSQNSVTKPWVGKELSYSLMRQLRDQSIAILPVRLDEAPLPPLLSDVKYADCRESYENGVKELQSAIFGLPNDV